MVPLVAYLSFLPTIFLAWIILVAIFHLSLKPQKKEIVSDINMTHIFLKKMLICFLHFVAIYFFNDPQIWIVFIQTKLSSIVISDMYLFEMSALTELINDKGSISFYAKTCVHNVIHTLFYLYLYFEFSTSWMILSSI